MPYSTKKRSDGKGYDVYKKGKKINKNPLSLERAKAWIKKMEIESHK